MDVNKDRYPSFGQNRLHNENVRDILPHLPIDLGYFNVLSELQAELSGRESGITAEQEYKIVTRVQYLNDLLLDIPEYYLALEQAKRLPCEDQSDSWQNLLYGNNVRLSIILLNEGYPLPLHDCPSAAGAMLVLSGEVNLKQFCVLDANAEIHEAIIRLRQQKDTSTSTGDVHIYNKILGTVYSLSSMTERSIILYVQVPPYAKRFRSCYFPITPMNQSTQGFFVHRIKMML